MRLQTVVPLRWTVAVSLVLLVGLSVAASGTQLLIPLYSCPSDEGGSLWRAVEAAASNVNIAVIWGIICEEDDYSTALDMLGAAGVSRLAYVATSDSSRPFKQVKAEMDFSAGFPIDGVFFDEVRNEPSAWDYNERIISYARSLAKVKTVIINSPYADEDFVRAMSADAVVVFENAFTDWIAFDGDEYAGVEPSRIAALIHHTPASMLKKALELASERGIGYVYATDRGWDQLPSYFKEEVGLLRDSALGR